MKPSLTGIDMRQQIIDELVQRDFNDYSAAYGVDKAWERRKDVAKLYSKWANGRLLQMYRDNLLEETMGMTSEMYQHIKKIYDAWKS